MATSDDRITLERFPLDYDPGGAEVRKTYISRVKSGFFSRYMDGKLVLDIGYKGSANPESKTVVPHALGIDTDYPGYDGTRLPFADETVDCVFSSHALEHITYLHAAIRDWFRVVSVGGFIVCFVPHQFLYEKKKFPPSRFNPEHNIFFTPGRLLTTFEEALEPNSFRVRHLVDNDSGFDYSIPPLQHSVGCYEIELVIQKLQPPAWKIE